MRIITFALILAFCLSGAFAQTNRERPTEWLTMIPETEEFEIEVPAELNGSRYQSKSSDPKLNRRYVRFLNGRRFYIFSDHPESPEQYKFVVMVIDHFKAKRTKFRLGDFEAERFSFAEPDFFHNGLIVFGKERVYVFQTISELENDEISERFLSSVKLRSVKTADLTESVTSSDKSITVTIPTAGFESRQDLGLVPFSSSQRPSRDEISHSSGPASGRDSKEKKLKALRVSIREVPAAKYTFLARFYEIAGTVQVNARLSADGTISDITALNKLPCGVTEQALAAAKNIKFVVVNEEKSEPYTTSTFRFSFGEPF